MEAQVLEIRPQAGPQEDFLATPADIAIYGGAAGGGKTYALLMEPMRHFGNPDFGAVYFRRLTTMITVEGGPWDTAQGLYSHVGGSFISNPTHRCSFPAGSKIEFRHLQYDNDVQDWQSSQIPLILFDELTHFSRKQFFYMLSRNRSVCGVRPYIRAACNPDPDSWVKEFIRWWLDDNGEFADPSKSGKIRWMVRSGDSIEWYSDKAEAFAAARRIHPDMIPQSVTFIPSKVTDNRILLHKDPGYLPRLMALPRYEREQLLNGNWKVRPSAGMIFSRRDFEILKVAPAMTNTIRYWDRAATVPSERNPDPDWTAGVKMGKTASGLFIIPHVCRFRGTPLTVKTTMKNMASQDGHATVIGIEEDPGAAGKSEADDLVRFLAGYQIHRFRPTQKKLLRWAPLAAQAEAGNVKLVEGSWNDPFLSELENLSDDESEYGHDDQGDAAGGAFLYLAGMASPDMGKQKTSSKPTTAGYREARW